MTGLTVAICTHDRPHQLVRALTSVMDQSPRPAEVLVVDNAPSNDAARRLVRERFPQVRYLCEPVPGLDFARNRALASATQDVVAFLDDDAVAAAGWGEAMNQAFASDVRVGLCTGRVEALKLDTPGERLFEANGGFSRGTERIELPTDAGRLLHGRRAPLIAWAISVGSGCNYGVRRTAALALGGFDEALDLGAALPGGGDHDLLWRMLQGGHTVVYQPAALAWHEHREQVEAVHAQIVGHQRAVIAFLGKQLVRASNGTRASLAMYLAWRLVKPGVRLARRAVRRDPLPARVLLRMWWNCWAGLVAYPRAKRLARARRQEYET
jgi:glycosyltransferase involved in cell wall biosynthesis